MEFYTDKCYHFYVVNLEEFKKRYALHLLMNPRNLLVRAGDLEGLLGTSPGDRGYLFLYVPPSVDTIISYRLITTGGELLTSAAEDVIRLAASRHDIKIAPFRHLRGAHEEQQHFAEATQYFHTSNHEIGLFARIKEAQASFFTLSGDQGSYQYVPVNYRVVSNTSILPYDGRLDAIDALLVALANSTR